MIIDAHVHLDRFELDYEMVKKLGFVTMAMPEKGTVKNLEEYENYFLGLLRYVKRLDEMHRIPTRMCVGIHPRRIPEDMQNGYDEILEYFLGLNHVVGIGEIGLENYGNEIEESVLRGQLDFVKKYKMRNPEFNKKICIHTPREDKVRVTEKILKILDKYPGYVRELVIIYHCNADIVGRVLNNDYYADLTIAEKKNNAEQIMDILNQQPLKSDARIITSSDALTKEDMDWFLQEVERFSELCENKNTKENILYNNAYRLFFSK